MEGVFDMDVGSHQEGPGVQELLGSLGMLNLISEICRTLGAIVHVQQWTL